MSHCSEHVQNCQVRPTSRLSDGTMTVLRASPTLVAHGCSTSLGYGRDRGPSRRMERASDLRWSQGDAPQQSRLARPPRQLSGPRTPPGFEVSAAGVVSPIGT